MTCPCKDCRPDPYPPATMRPPRGHWECCGQPAKGPCCHATAYADGAMADIAADIAAGVVPASVATFTDLHDYVDANEYVAGVPTSDGYGLVNAVTAEINRRLAKQRAS